MMYLNNVDIIVYPSFQWNDTLTNLVIKKEYVDKYLRLNKVYKVQMTDDSHYVSQFILLKVGKAISNKVAWPPLEQSDFNDFYKKFAKDKGTFAIKMTKDATVHTMCDVLNDMTYTS